MELKDTINLMTSSDYKDRFKAEYWQIKIRRNKLKAMIDNWDNLNFTPTCSKGLYVGQLSVMESYIGILEYRAAIEGVEL